MENWISYAWAIIIQLITAAIALVIYGHVSTGFETIVVSLLMLTYLSVQAFSMAYYKLSVELARGLDEDFKRIRKLLQNEPDETEKENFEYLEKLLHKQTVKMCMNGTGLFIIYIIALFHLFQQLL